MVDVQAGLPLMQLALALAIGASAASLPNPATLPAQTASAPMPARIVVYEAPTLNLVTPGEIAGGGLIDNLTRPDGSKIQLPSPSFLFATALRDNLSSRLGMPMSSVPDELLPRKPKKSPNPTGALTLEVYTDLNFLGYRAFAWTTYQYGYMGRAKLIDESGSVIWDKKCALKPAKTDETLQIGRTEFQNNGGQRLKDIIELATKRCAAMIVDQLEPKA